MTSISQMPEVVDGAVGPHRMHSGAYLSPGNSGGGYIATLKLSIASTAKGCLDSGLAGIVAYDRAERQDAYIGQINMITASSFCGPSGVIWGYDIARAPSLYDSGHRLGTVTRHDRRDIPIWSADPLLDATVRLFGTESQRRFPPMPGAMVICANKSVTVGGPTNPWCAIALAVAEDRSDCACLFIEDASDTAGGREPPVDIMAVAQSIIACGENQRILFKEIFVSVKALPNVPFGEVACALTCAPYITLAQGAIPEPTRPRDLLEMSLPEWESALRLDDLP